MEKARRWMICRSGAESGVASTLVGWQALSEALHFGMTCATHVPKSAIHPAPTPRRQADDDRQLLAYYDE